MKVAADTLARQEIVTALRRLGLVGAGETPPMIALLGGVSSDIWRVDLPHGPVCVKRALPRLKVEALWEAPVERNAYERAWIETVAALYPHAVPRVIAHDPTGGLFVMTYLDPADYPLWKARLKEGDADAAFARRVGATLADIHRATAGDTAMTARFPTDENFYALRLEPYLVATGRRHPDLSADLQALANATAGVKRALVHGDVSPKNILIGLHDPVFLDAECAWYGDPAFDLAFCLNHFLLKCLWTPRAARGFLVCFAAMAKAYLSGAAWEPRVELEARTARLLPALFLARVDGKSPVEYITDEHDKDRVRRVARALLAAAPARLESVRAAWAREIGL
ncbi:MAG: phosphotransferase family protein [Candidatus Methylomirabilales bacterium]